MLHSTIFTLNLAFKNSMKVDISSLNPMSTESPTVPMRKPTNK